MKLKIAITLFIPFCLAAPAQAQQQAQQQTQTPPTPQQVLAACVENRAETLPIPFTDVSPDHWAFKSVMTMYYCGAFRQATPLTSEQLPVTSEQLPMTNDK
jgi:hypothetical protein